MSKWSWFFLAVPVLGVAVFAVGDQHGWGLPENISTFGRAIDHLYYMILIVTGIVFIGTQLALCYILFRFGGRRKEGDRALYMHGDRKLEIAWTIIPAAVLLFIALYQLDTWVEVRFPSRKPNIPPLARVMARQFEWRISYPGSDGVLDTVDDIHVPNELHVVMNRRTLIELVSMDVLHDFYLPQLRVKQDAVPGLRIPVWFDALKSTSQFQEEHAAFTYRDVKARAEFLVALRQDKSPVAEYVREHMAPEAWQILKDYNDQFEPRRDVVEAVLAELNRQLDDPRLYDARRFADVKLAEETGRHLGLGPGGIRIRLLNRQLLQDAFPTLLKPLNRHYELVCAELCGWGHYKMKGRLVIHETQEDLDSWLALRRAEQETSR